MPRNILSHSRTHYFDRAFVEVIPLNADLVELQEHLFVLFTPNVSMREM